MPVPTNTLQDGTLHEQERRHFLSLLVTVVYGLLTRPFAAAYVTALQVAGLRLSSRELQ